MRGNKACVVAEAAARRELAAPETHPRLRRRRDAHHLQHAFARAGHERAQQLCDDAHGVGGDVQAPSRARRAWRRPSRAPTARASRYTGSSRRSRPMISRSAWLNWNDSTQVRTRPTRPSSAARSAASGSRASMAASGFGTTPSQYRWTIVVARLTRLPRSLARSALYRPRIVSSVKSASWPNTISRITKYLSAVDAEQPDVVRGPDDVAERLGHLRAVHEPPAVAHELSRDGESGGHQERRPVDAVLPDDFLADEMHVRGPVLVRTSPWPRIDVAEADRRHVVRQRVEPDVHDVRRIVRHGDAPRERRPADAEILTGRPR